MSGHLLIHTTITLLVSIAFLPQFTISTPLDSSTIPSASSENTIANGLKMLADGIQQLERNENANSINTLTQARDILGTTSSHTLERASCMMYLSRAHARLKQDTEAIQLSTSALELFNNIENTTRERTICKRTLAICNYHQGHNEEALSELEHVLVTFCGLPHSEPDQRICLLNMREILSLIQDDSARQGRSRKIIETLDQALSRPHLSPFTQAYLCHNIGWVLAEIREYQKANDFQLRALTLLETAPGSEHDQAICHYGIGGGLRELGQIDDAISEYQKAFSLQEAVHDQDRTRADSLLQLTRCALLQEDYEKAYEYADAALRVQRSIPNNNSEDLRTLPFLIGYLLEKMDRKEEALEAYHNGILSSLPAEPIDEVKRSSFINNRMGIIPMVTEVVVEAMRQGISPSKTNLMSTLINFQSFYNEGDLMGIIEFLDEFIGKTTGSTGTHMLKGLSRLGVADFRTMLSGQEDRIISLMKIVEDHGEEVGSYTWLPSAYQEIAYEYQKRGEYTDAMEYLQKALDMSRSREDGWNDQLDTLVSIGWLLKARGDYEEARLRFEETLQLLPPYEWNSSRRARVLRALGVISRDIGDYEASLKYLHESINEVKQSGNSLTTVNRELVELGWTHISMGNRLNAVEAWVQAAEGIWRITTSGFPTMTKAEKDCMCCSDDFGYNTSYIYSAVFPATNQPNNVGILGWSTSLHYKAIIPESIRIERGVILGETTPQWRESFTRYNSIKTRLANTSLANLAMGEGRKSNSLINSREEFSIQDDLNQVEKDLARMNRASWKKMKIREVTPKDVQGKIPEDSILLEYVRYCLYRFDLQEWEGEHYGVIVVPPGEGTIAAKDLGPADQIDATINQYRTVEETTLHEGRNPSAGDERNLNREGKILRQRLLDPIWEYISSAKRIYIAPESNIALIPFESLPYPNAPKGKEYITERHEIIYLTTGRDLVRSNTDTIIQNPKREEGRMLLIGAPDFNLPPIGRAKRKVGSALPKKSCVEKNSVETKSIDFEPSHIMGKTIKNTSWALLPNVKTTITSLAQSISNKSSSSVIALTGDEATEEILGQYPQPRAVHFATHGYFIQDEDIPSSTSESTNNTYTTDSDKEPLPIDTPLLRSMLVLAGANRREEDTFYLYQGQILSETEAITLTDEERAKARFVIGDGLLTALEAADLNLQGTELVSLIACKSGVGVPETGNGIAGLRQAFILAGAQSVIMSLWDVPVEESLAQTTTFYTHWLDGQGKYKAFRKSQLKALEDARTNRGCGHPFYWAGFIYAGQP